MEFYCDNTGASAAAVLSGGHVHKLTKGFHAPVVRAVRRRTDRFVIEEQLAELDLFDGFSLRFDEVIEQIAERYDWIQSLEEDNQGYRDLLADDQSYIWYDRGDLADISYGLCMNESQIEELRHDIAELGASIGLLRVTPERIAAMRRSHSS